MKDWKGYINFFPFPIFPNLSTNPSYSNSKIRTNLCHFENLQASFALPTVPFCIATYFWKRISRSYKCETKIVFIKTRVSQKYKRIHRRGVQRIHKIRRIFAIFTTILPRVPPHPQSPVIHPTALPSSSSFSITVLRKYHPVPLYAVDDSRGSVRN